MSICEAYFFSNCHAVPRRRCRQPDYRDAVTQRLVVRQAARPRIAVVGDQHDEQAVPRGRSLSLSIMRPMQPFEKAKAFLVLVIVGTCWNGHVIDGDRSGSAVRPGTASDSSRDHAVGEPVAHHRIVAPQSEGGVSNRRSFCQCCCQPVAYIYEA